MCIYTCEHTSFQDGDGLTLKLVMCGSPDDRHEMTGSETTGGSTGGGTVVSPVSFKLVTDIDASAAVRSHVVATSNSQVVFTNSSEPMSAQAAAICSSVRAHSTSSGIPVSVDGSKVWSGSAVSDGTLAPPSQAGHPCGQQQQQQQRKQSKSTKRTRVIQ